MTANEVAAAFSNVASGTTSAALTLANPVAANFGKFSGTFTAGFSTGAATSTGTVTATATTRNTDVTDLAVSGVVAVASATVTTSGTTVAASTVYGSITLNSQNTFTIKPGAKAYATASAPAADPTYANFTALGFEAKTINAKALLLISSSPLTWQTLVKTVTLQVPLPATERLPICLPSTRLTT